MAVNGYISLPIGKGNVEVRFGHGFPLFNRVHFEPKKIRVSILRQRGTAKHPVNTNRPEPNTSHFHSGPENFACLSQLIVVNPDRRGITSLIGYPSQRCNFNQSSGSLYVDFGSLVHLEPRNIRVSVRRQSGTTNLPVTTIRPVPNTSHSHSGPNDEVHLSLPIIVCPIGFASLMASCPRLAPSLELLLYPANWRGLCVHHVPRLWLAALWPVLVEAGSLALA